MTEGLADVLAAELQRLDAMPEQERRDETGYTPISERTCARCEASLADQPAYLPRSYGSGTRCAVRAQSRRGGTTTSSRTATNTTARRGSASGTARGCPIPALARCAATSSPGSAIPAAALPASSAPTTAGTNASGASAAPQGRASMRCLRRDVHAEAPRRQDLQRRSPQGAVTDGRRRPARRG